MTCMVKYVDLKVIKVLLFRG